MDQFGPLGSDVDGNTHVNAMVETVSNKIYLDPIRGQTAREIFRLVARVTAEHGAGNIVQVDSLPAHTSSTDRRSSRNFEEEDL